jgi:hypothetical protein
LKEEAWFVEPSYTLPVLDCVLCAQVTLGPNQLR